MEERKRSKVAIEPPSVHRCYSTVQMEIGGGQSACRLMCTPTSPKEGSKSPALLSQYAFTMKPFRASASNTWITKGKWSASFVSASEVSEDLWDSECEGNMVAVESVIRGVESGLSVSLFYAVLFAVLKISEPLVGLISVVLIIIESHTRLYYSSSINTWTWLELWLFQKIWMHAKYDFGTWQGGKLNALTDWNITFNVILYSIGMFMKLIQPRYYGFACVSEKNANLC